MNQTAHNEAAAMEAELAAYYEHFMGLEADAEAEAQAAHDTGQAQATEQDALDVVCSALAAFLNDDINSHWHPSYRPMIDAGKAALAKAGWKP